MRPSAAFGTRVGGKGIQLRRSTRCGEFAGGRQLFYAGRVYGDRIIIREIAYSDEEKDSATYSIFLFCGKFPLVRDGIKVVY